MRGRRHYKNYRGVQRKKVKPDFTPVVVILCLAVGCGYATAKYVVDPVVNYVPELLAGQTEESAKGSDAENKEDEGEAQEKKSEAAEEKEAAQDGASGEKTDQATVVEDEAEVKEKGDIKGYALQFGCYSSRKSAETAMKSLTADGLQIIEQDDMFKITGKIHETKEAAKDALQKMEEDTGAFVTTIYK